jgi:Trk-type K+ transport system membrane component
MERNFDKLLYPEEPKKFIGIGNREINESEAEKLNMVFIFYLFLFLFCFLNKKLTVK